MHRHLAHRLLVDTIHVLLGFPLALIGFVLSLVTLALGLGTAVLVVGLPVLAAALFIARAFAQVERGRLVELLGRPLPAPRYRHAVARDGWYRRALTPLTCPQSWLDLLYALVRLPMAIVAFAVTLAWWAATVTGLLYPVYGWILHATVPGYNDWTHLLWPDANGALLSTVLNGLFGLLCLVTLPLVVRFCAALDSGLSRALLVGPALVDRAAGIASEPGWSARAPRTAVV